MTGLLVSCFPNAKALPLWIGCENGIFSDLGLQVALDHTTSSKAQRRDLEVARVHIAQSAVDNALAMILQGVDVIIVAGGEGGMNQFIVQADISTFADFRGRILAVDSPDTAYALQAKRLLASHGLRANVDYFVEPVGNSELRFQTLISSARFGGAVLNPPFSAQARLHGLGSLGRLVDFLGPYQAGGAFLRRDWAAKNSDTVERYLQAYIEALRWMRNLGNRIAAVEILQRRLGLSAEVAGASFEELIDPAAGFNRDAKLDPVGFTNVLATRAQVDGVSDRLAASADYIDESYYRRALASADASA